jgi:hypothetical protein
MGIVVLLTPDNGPENARWLDPSSRQWLSETLRREPERVNDFGTGGVDI